MHFITAMITAELIQTLQFFADVAIAIEVARPRSSPVFKLFMANTRGSSGSEAHESVGIADASTTPPAVILRKSRREKLRLTINKNTAQLLNKESGRYRNQFISSNA